MIHRQGRSASRRPEHRPEPIRASGHDRRSYTTGWDTIDAEFILPCHLPRKKRITDNADLGYFLPDNQGTLRDNFYDPIFDDLWERLHAIESR
jgi:hypothetical protein